MNNLIIVARDCMLSSLEELLCENGVTGYTIMNNVMGKGLHGRVYGTFLNPDSNTIIFSVLASEQAEQVVSALKMLRAERKSALHDEDPIPLKVFLSPCEECI
ncbi:MAG: hypothetical protein U0236_08200 [Nitrospira sp.]